jgi:uncharacterized protein
MAIPLHEYQLVLLRHPANPPEYDEQSTARIQQEHLAFYRALRDSGQVVTNGPMRDQPDERLRGMAIFALGSLEQARQLAATDPWVLAGGLVTEVMTWWCPPGTMIRPGTPVMAG